MKLTVQELVDLLRDHEERGYNYRTSAHDTGICGGDPNATRIEGRYNLKMIVHLLNERAERYAKNRPG